jgi:hypothetical protein
LAEVGAEKGDIGVIALGASLAFVPSLDVGFGANKLVEGNGFCSVIGFSAATGFGTNKLPKGFPPAGLGVSCSVGAVGLGANKLGVDVVPLDWAGEAASLLEKSDEPDVVEGKLKEG